VSWGCQWRFERAVLEKVAATLTSVGVLEPKDMEGVELERDVVACELV